MLKKVLMVIITKLNLFKAIPNNLNLILINKSLHFKTNIYLMPKRSAKTQ